MYGGTVSPRFDSASDGRSETFQIAENGDQNETYRSSQPIDPMTSAKPMVEKETDMRCSGVSICDSSE